MADAIENFSNRSPFPTLHLLRESSIERAMEVMSDTDAIYRRNIETLQRLGIEGWQALWARQAGLTAPAQPSRSGAPAPMLSRWGVNNLPDPYAESIDPSVQCTTCEAVCCRLTVVLMPEDHVPAWLIDHDEHGMEILAKGEDGWCAAVESEHLRLHHLRRPPGICRKYAMGSPSCRDERQKWFGATIPTAVHML